jgi:hypothetical protein
MESDRPLCDLPDTRKGTFELWIDALAERRERHTGPLKQLAAQFALECFDAVAERRLGDPTALRRSRELPLFA